MYTMPSFVVCFRSWTTGLVGRLESGDMFCSRATVTWFWVTRSLCSKQACTLLDRDEGMYTMHDSNSTVIQELVLIMLRVHHTRKHQYHKSTMAVSQWPLEVSFARQSCKKSNSSSHTTQAWHFSVDDAWSKVTIREMIDVELFHQQDWQQCRC
jgi:hypothetical protein